MKPIIPSIHERTIVHGCAGKNRKFKVALSVASTLMVLVAAGEQGVAAADLKVPDPAGTIRQLRRMGVVIETRRKNNPNGGKGLDLRYVLRGGFSFTGMTVVKEYHYAL